MPMPICDEDMNAYIDGVLKPHQSMEIAARLARAPAEAARAEAFRAQRDALHALFDPVLDQPIPERLSVLLRGAREKQRAR
jgi:anti-sigma factor RsiW